MYPRVTQKIDVQQPRLPHHCVVPLLTLATQNDRFMHFLITKINPHACIYKIQHLKPLNRKVLSTRFLFLKYSNNTINCHA